MKLGLAVERWVSTVILYEIFSARRKAARSTQESKQTEVSIEIKIRKGVTGVIVSL